MISEKLLSAVTGKKCIMINEGVPKHLKSDNTVFYYIENEYGEMQNINIYELMHMVKEWAWKLKRFTITSYIRYKKSWAKLWVNEFLDDRDDEILYKGKTEPEAVFKCGEWVLKELENETT